VSTHELWYLSRGTGMVAFTLLSLALLLGISSRAPRGVFSLPRFVVAGLHRNVSLLLTAFIAVHVSASILDPYAGLRLVNAFVPFTSSYRPLWVGFGAVALDLLIAVVLTSLVRARLGLRAWRVVHWTVYAMWPVALVHALGTGSDVRSGLLLVVGAMSSAVVIAAVAIRVLTADISPRTRAAWLCTGTALVVMVGFWTLAGPTQPDWSRVAGEMLRPA
jgi:methionine sulfoxide reductase heme-binding subunit